MTVFTNPAPISGDRIYYTVAAVGVDKVILGARHLYYDGAFAGSAHLFDLNGHRISTFTNPTPSSSDAFGFSVSAVGNDKVLIGSPGDNAIEPGAGAAYLFDTNGTLLATFTEPMPNGGQYFGYSVTVVGSDRLLIGAIRAGAGNPGAAYLFALDGTLLATFANPTPSYNECFGFSVAAVGADKVLIGAYAESTFAPGAGAAYLFDTRGTLITSFTNPTPATEEYFGWSVTGIGTNNVLIGAPYESTEYLAGAAYLFDLNGTLLNTFTNPPPTRGAVFGRALAAVGPDEFVIGADGVDGNGASDSGVVHWFSLHPQSSEPPSINGIKIERLVDGRVRVNWPLPLSGLVLESTPTMAGVSNISWVQVLPPYETNATHLSITFEPKESRFYRLRPAP